MFSSSYWPVLEDYLALHIISSSWRRQKSFIWFQFRLISDFSPDFHLTIRKTCFHINKRKCRKLYYFRRKRTINDADVLKFHLDNLDFQNNQSRNNFYSLNIYQCLRMNELNKAIIRRPLQVKRDCSCNLVWKVLQLSGPGPGRRLMMPRLGQSTFYSSPWG